MTRDFRIPDLSASMNAVVESQQRRNNPAGYMFARIKNQISRFERRLGADREMGIVVGAGAAGAYHLRKFTFDDPDLLVFHCVDADQNEAMVIQHYSQLSVVLIAVHTLKEQPHRMGFGLPPVAEQSED